MAEEETEQTGAGAAEDTGGQDAPLAPEPEQAEQAPADGDRTWFGGDAPETPDETKVNDDGLGPSDKQMPEWVPAEYHDPSKRAELLETLGFTKSEVDEQQAENDRPEWLPEKFESPEEMAKSYKELEQRMSGKSQVPETYELDLPEGLEELPDEDIQAFKDAGLSNDAAQKMMGYFQEHIMPQMQEQRTEKEAQQLASGWGMVDSEGKPDQEAMASRMASVKEWANNNVPSGVVKELSTTASGVQQLYNLMQSKGSGQRAAPSASGKPDPSRLQELVNDERYWSDPAFQEQVNRQFRDAYD